MEMQSGELLVITFLLLCGALVTFELQGNTRLCQQLKVWLVLLKTTTAFQKGMHRTNDNLIAKKTTPFQYTRDLKW